MADECNMSRESSRGLPQTEKPKKKKKRKRKKGVKFKPDEGSSEYEDIPKPEEKPRFEKLIENKE